MDRQKLSTLFDLTGRVWLVTGGTRGIGRAVAEGLGAAGAAVVVCGRKADACAATQADLAGRGIDALGVQAHLGDLDDVKALVGRIDERFGRLDVVVNNAATALAQPVGAFEPEAFAKVFDVDVRGPVFLVQEAIPLLEASGHGAVVNVLSGAAFRFAADQAIYAAAKLALLSFTRSMAAALGPRGIRVNTLSPGTVDTDMMRAVDADSQLVYASQAIMNRLADPDEMVGPALFLASDASSFVTGQVLVADGGAVPY